MNDSADSSTAPSAPSANGQSAWSFDPRTLAMVALASIVVLALIALASAIDLPESDDSVLETSLFDEPGSGSGSGFGSGASGGSASGSGGSGGSSSDGGSSAENGLGGTFGGGGRIDLGTGQELGVRPIPGCPGGFAFGDVLVVPDPEACGMAPVPPGGQGQNELGQRVLVPDETGNVGGFRLGPDGQVELLAPNQIGSSDFVIGQRPDGTFGLFRGDGTRIEIRAGDDGLYLSDPLTGEEQFIPGSGTGPFQQSDPDSPNLQNPNSQNPSLQNPNSQNPNSQNPGLAQPEFDDLDRDSADDGDSRSWMVPTLIVVLVLALAALLMLALGRTKSDDDDEDEEEPEVQDTIVDYSAEISALDRMLWEIDQEPDPRTAIRRVYAALETGLENPDMARRVSETPGIYLRRILGRFDALHAPLQELTMLFEQARFSQHEITSDMRDSAVNALIAVRTHYTSVATQAGDQPQLDPLLVSP